MAPLFILRLGVKLNFLIKMKISGSKKSKSIERVFINKSFLLKIILNNNNQSLVVLIYLCWSVCVTTRTFLTSDPSIPSSLLHDLGVSLNQGQSLS